MRVHRAPGTFTGLHLLFTMVIFFGIIIAVNIGMAVLARTSWTGFVVENSYVASQQFNEKMAETRAQAALGWAGRFDLDAGTVRYAIGDAAGNDIPLDAVTVTFRRPVDDREDHTVVLERDGDVYAGRDDTADGVWIVEIVSDANLPSPYRDTRRVHVRDGRLQ